MSVTSKNIFTFPLSKDRGPRGFPGAAGGVTVPDAGDILTNLLTVDGTGSGLDADLLDGQHASYFAPTASPTLTGILTAGSVISVGPGDYGNFTARKNSNLGGNCWYDPAANWKSLGSSADYGFAVLMATAGHPQTNPYAIEVYVDTSISGANEALSWVNIFNIGKTGIVYALDGTSTNWNTAYGWGNWASNFGAGSGTICQGNDSRVNNGQTAYSWGDHASANYHTGAGTSGYIPKYTGPYTQGNSLISESSETIGINGGLHVGGTSSAGDNNLIVDGTAEHTGVTTLTGYTKTVGGVHVGGTSDPGADNLLVDGIIRSVGDVVAYYA